LFVGDGEISTIGLRCLFPELGTASFRIKEERVRQTGRQIKEK